jgi:hypothetical protein
MPRRAKEPKFPNVPVVPDASSSRRVVGGLSGRQLDHRDVVRWVAANWLAEGVTAADAPSAEAAGLLEQVRSDESFRRAFYASMYMRTMDKEARSEEEARFADDGGVLLRLDTFLNSWKESVNGFEAIARNAAEELVEAANRKRLREWRRMAAARSESELAVESASSPDGDLA